MIRAQLSTNLIETQAQTSVRHNLPNKKKDTLSSVKILTASNGPLCVETYFVILFYD